MSLKEYSSSHILIIYKNKFLLQHRDSKKKIHIPNFWGLFGGKVKIKETPKECILREINEEINIKIKNVNFFINIKSSAKFLNPTRNINYFYANIKDKPNKIKIFEGQGFRFFSFDQLSKIQINPFDYSAISMFYYLKILKKDIIPKKKFLKLK